MPIKRLNNRNILNLEGPGAGKQILYWDDELKGFGLRVTAGSKTFIAQSVVGGKDRRVKIGPWPAVTPEDARAQAKELLAQMSKGTDPNEAKAAERARQKTLADIFQDYRQRKQLRPATVKVYEAAFKLCLSDWSSRTLEQITRDEVERRYDKVCKGWRAVEGHHSRGNGAALASQAMRLLGQLYNFESAVHDRDIANPVKRLTHVRRGWSKSNQRHTVVLDKEMPLFYSSTMKLRFQKSRDYLLLLLMTGLRAQEAAGLTWDEVDLNDAHIIIPKERTKNGVEHGIPLSEFAKALLSRRLEQNEQKSRFVFPGDGESGHYIEPKAAFEYVSSRLGKDITPHTLRHTFATVSQRLLVHPRLQAKLLNHLKGDITERYIHSDIEMLREPMKQINDHFLSLMVVPKSETDNVVVAPTEAQ